MQTSIVDKLKKISKKQKVVLLILTFIVSTFAIVVYWPHSTTIQTAYPLSAPMRFGSAPMYGVVQLNDGSFYGTTSYGGSHNEGTIFRLRTFGSLTIFTTLYSFDAGEYPSSGLTLGKDNYLYGRLEGGPYTDNYSAAYRVSQRGSFEILRSLGASNNYSPVPASHPIEGPDGDLYTTTSEKIYRFDSSTPLYTFPPHTSFQATCGIPLGPSLLSVSGLTLGSDGNFYGTTADRGAFGKGTIFKVTPSGNFTTLFSFSDPIPDPGCG